MLRRYIFRSFFLIAGLLVAFSVSVLGLSGAASTPAASKKSTPDRDRVAMLNQRLDAAKATLTFEPGGGYLRSVLEALRLPVESQTAVFSPTSFHGTQVSALNPRAIYFDDNVAVGWVRGTSLIEAASLDPGKGMVFYTLDQNDKTKPRFRENRTCLSCHQSRLTSNVPGWLVLSTSDAYHPISGTEIFTDQRTPLTDRWGGWFVTGLSTRWHHQGNRVGQGWLRSLYDQFYTKGYLTEYSDIVALMTLEHQARATNLIMKAATEARNETGSIDGPLQQTVNDLTDYLMFRDEAPIPARIMGTSGFTEKFAAAGPQDRQGRSLRQFDLSDRLMRYPCSYMVYSDAFNALPDVVRTAVYTRMWGILTETVKGEGYAQLPVSDRRAIAEILRDTKTDLPAFFQSSKL